MDDEARVIEVLLDGRAHAVPAGTTLAALVAAQGLAPNKVTTAVDGLFVPRGAREARVLQAGEAVVLFQPIVGG